MKEEIYTIPVNEAYDTDCECPLCELERKLEFEAVDYTLGAAMMESDFRKLTNEKGFCNKHYKMLFDMNNKLSLSLILETHLKEVRKKIAKMSRRCQAAKRVKKFKKKNSVILAGKLTKTLSDWDSSCMICDKINDTMKRYADVLLYMWANDEEFKKKFDNSKGLCLKHSKLLIDTAEKSLNNSSHLEFLASVFEQEKNELERLQDELRRFSDKFDYRNANTPWGNSQNAPKRTIEKLSGYIDHEIKMSDIY